MTHGAGAGAADSAAPDSQELLEQYASILLGRGLEWGLLGPREGERVWSRHIENSLLLCDVIPQGVRVADVGSGAGLPGIPVALARPDLEVKLIEPLLRRARFLELAVAELGIGGRVHVVRARAEDLDEKFDVVIGRAVAPLARLLGWTAPLFRDGGRLLALKGTSAEAEIEAAAKELRRRGMRAEVLELSSDRGASGRAILVRGAGATRTVAPEP